MTELPDHELLDRYVRHHSESAFAELVRRHLPLVYSAAVRVTGDPESAQDIAQVVFLDLADKAGSLPAGVVLPGWLYRAATFAGSKRVRSDLRRRTREREAMRLHNLETGGDDSTRGLLPLLDEALERLEESDRNALVLRFLSRMEFRAVGEALGISDEAARKRVERALERLRGLMGSAERVPSSSTLALALFALGDPTLPGGLQAAVTQAIRGGFLKGAGAAGGVPGTIWVAKDFLALAAALVAAGVVISGHWTGRGAASPPGSGVFPGADAAGVVPPVSTAVPAPESEAAELRALGIRAAELRKLLASAGPASASEARPESAGPVLLVPGRAVPLSALTDAGAATPEAALQSMVAAHQKLDLERLLQLTAMGEGEAARASAENGDAAAVAELQAQVDEARVRGDTLELLAVRPEGEFRAEVETVQRRPGLDAVTNTQVLGKTSTGWKRLPIVISRPNRSDETGDPRPPPSP